MILVILYQHQINQYSSQTVSSSAQLEYIILEYKTASMMQHLSAKSMIILLTTDWFMFKRSTSIQFIKLQDNSMFLFSFSFLPSSLF